MPGSFLLAVLAAATISARQDSAGDWPAVTREARPWTRWWWHGSAVDRPSLTAELETLRAAGIGGVEVTPIYGARGSEARFIPYLSPRWVQMLEHTLREAQRLGLGVDIATGTGWPFGGPWVDDDIAPRAIAHRTWRLDPGQRIGEPLRMRQTPLVRRAAGRRIDVAELADPVAANQNLQELALDQVKYPRDLPLAAVVAYGASGRIVDLTDGVGADGVLGWTAPEPSTVYALFVGWHGKLVERAAPGGEGNVIDHFSRDAIRRYLARFDRAFTGDDLGTLRGFFKIPTRSTTRPGRETGRRGCSMSSGRGEGTTCGTICPRSWATTPKSGIRVHSSTIARRFPICSWRPSPPNGVHGRAGVALSSGTRRMDPPRISWICMRRATSRRRKEMTFRGSSGRRRPRMSPGGGWLPPKRPHGSASTFDRRWPTSVRRSISSSSPASTTSSITGPRTRRMRSPGPAASSTPPSNSRRRTRGGMTSRRSTGTSHAYSRSSSAVAPITTCCSTFRFAMRSPSAALRC